MKALAWDDQANAPDEALQYMKRLATELGRLGIQVDLTSDSIEFTEKLKEGGYDFFITDWFDESETKAKGGAPRGAVLVNAIRKDDKLKPIFVISRRTARIDQMLLDVARPVFLKSKDVTVSWLAYDIAETLRDMGLMVDTKSVFIIGGNSSKSSSELSLLEAWTQDHGLSAKRLSSRQSQEGINPNLMRELQTCAAFIALCTADEAFASESSEKRQLPATNVVFELGLVHGLPQGAKKLIVLRQVGELLQDKAVLDLRWGGHQELTFKDSVSDVKDELKKRLKALGVKMD